MPAPNDSLFERFLAPLVNTILVDKEAARELYQKIDWLRLLPIHRNSGVVYPNYYQHDYHGFSGGYLSDTTAVTYDSLVPSLLPPNESLVRQGLMDAIRCYPRRILDLGCGTGSMTMMLHQKFPDAEVIGLDLSPYMLVVADYKQQSKHRHTFTVQWMHGNAASVSLPSESIDLVTASLLFRDIPATVSQTIIREAFRLLTPGGELVILDGNQSALRHATWLTQFSQEPYIQSYAKASIDQWLESVGYGDIHTHDWWWLHQVTRGVKPVSATKQWDMPINSRFESDGWVPA